MKEFDYEKDIIIYFCFAFSLNAHKHSLIYP